MYGRASASTCSTAEVAARAAVRERPLRHLPDVEESASSEQNPAGRRPRTRTRRPPRDPRSARRPRRWPAPRWTGSGVPAVAGCWTGGPGWSTTGAPSRQPLYWRVGMCDARSRVGRCPRPRTKSLCRRRGRGHGVGVGDLYLGASGRPVRRSPADDQVETYGATSDRQLPTSGRRHVPIDDPASQSWFDLSRFSGLEKLRPSPSRHPGSAEPAAPALLVAPESMTSQTFLGGVGPAVVGALGRGRPSTTRAGGRVALLAFTRSGAPQPRSHPATSTSRP